MRLAFVAVAGDVIGYGHLSRCLSLADCARRYGVESSFLVFDNGDVAPRVERNRYACTTRPLSELGEGHTNIVRGWESTFDAAVVDFAHPAVLRDIERARYHLQRLRDKARWVWIIDSLGEDALAHRMPDMPVDVVVTPYVGATIYEGTTWRSLAGPEYAVLSLQYADVPARTVRDVADRVLVSCGGSDPKRFSTLVLEGLEQIKLHMSIRVIVGPLFPQDLTEALQARAAVARHSIELVHAPQALAKHMLWSDAAVAASGLIKYELAATSTPAILMSIDRAHDIVNRPFVSAGTAWDLGTDFDAKSIADAVANLLGDHAARSSMASAGHKLIDGRGADRLISLIMRACRAAE